MILCSGVLFLLIVGLLGIFAKDIVWELTVWQNQMKGVASERTDAWDLMTTIGGVISIVFALLGIYVLLNGGG
jgi:uncharacterized membrane protein